MANAFKSGASQSRTTDDFNERAKALSERLGAIEKPLQMKRGNAPRRSFKAGPRPEADTEPKADHTESQTDATENTDENNDESTESEA